MLIVCHIWHYNIQVNRLGCGYIGRYTYVYIYIYTVAVSTVAQLTDAQRNLLQFIDEASQACNDLTRYVNPITPT